MSDIADNEDDDIVVLEDVEEDSDGWEECDDSAPSVNSHLCLFCDRSFPDALQTFEHCRNEHDFDICRLKGIHGLDCIAYIKLVNFVRSTHPESNVLTRVGSTPWDSDEYMIPVIPDDMMLQFDIEEMDVIALSVPTNASGENVNDSGNNDNNMISVPASHYAELISRLKAAELRVDQATDTLQIALTDVDKMRSWANETLLSGPVLMPSVCDVPNVSEDKLYFESYGHYSIHEEMLKDKVRTCSYRDAIYNNCEHFQDKVVLDIGCGTGILSMFAAASGAKLVIGVDQSDIIYQAMDIVRENGFKDVITLLKGRMEEVELPVEKVDIIISEWMGYFLLYESMLDTVLWARDRYLAPGGLILPNHCSLSVAGICDMEAYQQHYAFWDDVYGFKMSCMKSAVVAEPDVGIVNSEKVITEPCVIQEIPIDTCQTSDLEFSSSFKLPVKVTGHLTAIIGYFDIDFLCLTNKVSFSTSPSSTATHWKQTAFLLDDPIAVSAGEVLDGHLTCRKNRTDPRSLQISLSIGRQKTLSYVMQ